MHDPMDHASPSAPAGRGWRKALDRFWQTVFGPPDLGPVDFARLQRSRSPNDALVCPKGFSPQAVPDEEPPVFPVPASRLRALVAEVALSEPDTVRVASAGAQDRYLVRTRLMRFPDTVVVEVMECGADRSTLALSSRSQIGRSDLGVNRRRLARWLSGIEALVSRSGS